MLTMIIYAICGTLSAAGLWLAFRSVRRKRYAAALRTAGVALLPIGLAMTGVVRFVVNMTVNPIAWVGFATIGLAAVFYMTSRLAEGRGATDSSGGASESAGAAAPEVAAPEAAAPALPTGGSNGSPAKKGGEEDFSDIEDILKRHGI